MKIHLTELAERQINQTAEYLLQEFGRKTRSEFRHEVQHYIRLLRRNPNLGPVEPLLAHRTLMYRGLVVKPYNKIIYVIMDDVIEVVAVWDTRRDPATLFAFNFSFFILHCSLSSPPSPLAFRRGGGGEAIPPSGGRGRLRGGSGGGA